MLLLKLGRVVKVSQRSDSLDDGIFQRSDHVLMGQFFLNPPYFLTTFSHHLFAVFERLKVFRVDAKCLPDVHSLLGCHDTDKHLRKRFLLVSIRKLHEKVTLTSFLRYCLYWQILLVKLASQNFPEHFDE